jgi:GNAT superfamily N-acetyltransferase
VAHWTAQRVLDAAADDSTLRAASSIAVTGWGRPEPDQAELARQLGRVQHYLSTGSEFQVVAYLAGKPVSAAGCTLHGEVAQLWGGITLPDARRRGAYRAVLAERLRLARAHGASLALVKAKPDTSAPILLRAGFTDYGQQRRYRLATG